MPPHTFGMCLHNKGIFCYTVSKPSSSFEKPPCLPGYFSHWNLITKDHSWPPLHFFIHLKMLSSTIVSIFNFFPSNMRSKTKYCVLSLNKIAYTATFDPWVLILPPNFLCQPPPTRHTQIIWSGFFLAICCAAKHMKKLQTKDRDADKWAFTNLSPGRGRWNDLWRLSQRN